MKTPEEILKEYCPSMDTLFLDDNGKQFRERVVKAMMQYAQIAVDEQREIMSKHLNMRNVPKVKITTEL